MSTPEWIHAAREDHALIGFLQSRMDVFRVSQKQTLLRSRGVCMWKMRQTGEKAPISVRLSLDISALKSMVMVSHGSCCLSVNNGNFIYYFLREQNSPGWCGLVDWVLAYKPKGCWFDSHSGQMPGLQAKSPVGGMWKATPHCCFSPSLSPSLPLSLKINKWNLQKEREQNSTSDKNTT